MPTFHHDMHDGGIKSPHHHLIMWVHVHIREITIYHTKSNVLKHFRIDKTQKNTASQSLYSPYPFLSLSISHV